MAHMLEQMPDGTYSFITSSEDNWWHRLGHNVQRTFTVDEAIEVGDLTRVYDLWNTRAYRVNEDGSEDTMDLPDNFAVIGEHPKVGRTAHGVVGNRYSVIQIREGFAILNDLVDISGSHFETAGSIMNGNRVFMTLKLPKHIKTGTDQRDHAEVYLIAWNSFDGSQSFTLAVTPVRVVCKNTLDLAMGRAWRTFRIRHTEKAEYRLQEARNALSLTFDYVDALQEDVDRLLDKVYFKEQFDELVKQLLPVPQDDKVKDFVKARIEDSQAQMRQLWYSPHQDGIRNTAWGALSTVTEWADHYSPVRAKDNRDEARMVKVMVGNAAPIKQQALEILRAA